LQLGREVKGDPKTERLTELQHKAEAWDKLALPPGHKNIVQALIQSHFSSDNKTVFDLVRDKGKSIVIPS
jgi:hypothetical protein